jgi:FxsC-like protein
LLEGDGVHGPEPAADDGAYFFLSYAHANRGNDQDTEDQDVWVHQLFRDLCGYIAQITGLPASKVGFMDRELRSGNEWPWRLSRNLATCRVFVPLYSRRYFQSAHCGKEWSAFRNRARNGAAQASSHAETIIPALWSPVRVEQFPLAAKSIHFEPRDFGPTYAEYGFFAIMKVNRFKDDYDWTVLHLARHIVEVAERTQVPPGPTIGYDSLPNAFEEGAPADMPGDKRLRIIVAAPHLGDLPAGRSGNYYGQAASDWNPYTPDSVEPLAEYARVLARYLGFRPEISDLYEQEDDLLNGDGPATGPAVLLVDPWETTRPHCQRILARLDELSKPWIQLVVVWNRKDPEMTGAEAELRAALDAAMPITRRDRVRMTELQAARGVPAIEDIPPVLGDSMRHAARQYLKYAEGRQAGETGRVPPHDGGTQATPPISQEHEDG